MNPEKKLQEVFVQRRPVLEKYGHWVTEKIVSALNDALRTSSEVDFLKITPKPRVKDVDSFLEKALIRKASKYKDPINDIVDQVGVRFVVLLYEHVDFMEKVITSIPDFDAQKDRDYETEKLTRPDYFAYQAKHYVVRSKCGLELEGVKIPASTACEVQIRTLLQHAYAEIAHEADYKPSIILPEQEQVFVRRSLAKGSALIETTDEVFKEIQNRFNAYNKHLDEILLQSIDIYEKMINEKIKHRTYLTMYMADTYRNLIKNVSVEELNKYYENNKYLINIINDRRGDSVLYRDPIIILLYFIIENYKKQVQNTWPIESTYFDKLALDIGVL